MFFANFLIALREGVEASLIVGVIVAYLVKVGRKDLLPATWAGVGLAAALPLGLGAYMTWGPYTLTFAAQEILGGSLSLLAVAMVTWMILWMARNAAGFSRHLTREASQALAQGTPLGVVWIAALAVGREGVETALFVWATVKSSAQSSLAAPVLGVLAGLSLAILIGWLVYTGAARINLNAFFTLTGLLLVLVAAGVVSYGIGDLQEANVLPGWGTPLYDLSGLLDGSLAPWLTTSSSWWVILEAMFNVNLAPTLLQTIGWWLYLIVVLPMFLIRSNILTPATAAPSRPADTPLPRTTQEIS